MVDVLFGALGALITIVVGASKNPRRPAHGPARRCVDFRENAPLPLQKLQWQCNSHSSRAITPSWLASMQSKAVSVSHSLPAMALILLFKLES
jgi:hypothetical protein